MKYFKLEENTLEVWEASYAEVGNQLTNIGSLVCRGVGVIPWDANLLVMVFMLYVRGEHIVMSSYSSSRGVWANATLVLDEREREALLKCLIFSEGDEWGKKAAKDWLEETEEYIGILAKQDEGLLEEWMSFKKYFS